MSGRKYIYIACFLPILVYVMTEKPSATQPETVPALFDSLKTVFYDIRDAVRYNNPDQFFHLVDPEESVSLQRIVKKHGYTSLTSYLTRQFINWPDPDTLVFHALKGSDDFIRLTYTGQGKKIRYKEARVRYTFFLFRRHSDGWKLVAVSALENPRYDLYGNEITIHETDLPPKLRFPRI